MFNGFKRKKEFLERENSMKIVQTIVKPKVEHNEKKAPKVKKAKPIENLVEENNKETKEQGNE